MVFVSVVLHVYISVCERLLGLLFFGWGTSGRYSSALLKHWPTSSLSNKSISEEERVEKKKLDFVKRIL